MRPIDGDYLVNKLNEAIEDSTGISALAFMVIRSLIESLPTVPLNDLRPKGRWNPLPEDDREQMVGDQCSLCGYEHFGSRFNFCPNCGADMREGESHDFAD